MDFFGVGPLELFLILLLAFLFFGPEKLPEIASKIGRVYRNLTKATTEITRTINEEINKEAEKKEIPRVDQLPSPAANVEEASIPVETKKVEELFPPVAGHALETNKPEIIELVSTLTSDEKRND